MMLLNCLVKECIHVDLYTWNSSYENSLTLNAENDDTRNKFNDIAQENMILRRLCSANWDRVIW